eukprot:m.163421 g.163421  ORF g.163421 m.163421 type:complete len:379 (+) comp17110_c11_seq1:1925-3061(+)
MLCYHIRRLCITAINKHKCKSLCAVVCALCVSRARARAVVAELCGVEALEHLLGVKVAQRQGEGAVGRVALALAGRHGVEAGYEVANVDGGRGRRVNVRLVGREVRDARGGLKVRGRVVDSGVLLDGEDGAVEVLDHAARGRAGRQLERAVAAARALRRARRHQRRGNVLGRAAKEAAARARVQRQVLEVAQVLLHKRAARQTVLPLGRRHRVVPRQRQRLLPCCRCNAICQSCGSRCSRSLCFLLLLVVGGHAKGRRGRARSGGGGRGHGVVHHEREELGGLAVRLLRLLRLLRLVRLVFDVLGLGLAQVDVVEARVCAGVCGGVEGAAAGHGGRGVEPVVGGELAGGRGRVGQVRAGCRHDGRSRRSVAGLHVAHA